MARTTEELLKAIDEMTIYAKDYNVITDLLGRATPAFFTKVLEEVIDGNLYWSDFEKFFANTNYPKLLDKQLETQGRLEDQVQKYISFRNMNIEDFNRSEQKFAFIPPLKPIESNYEHDINNKLTDEAEILYNNDLEKYTKELNFYNSEYKKQRDQIIYDITKPGKDDNILIQAYKIKIYNAIKNGEYYIDLKNNTTRYETDNTDGTNERFNEIEIDADGNEKVTKYRIKDTGINKIKITTDNKEEIVDSYEYINPDDIFFFIHSYYIPLNYSNQILDDFDKEFMNQYGLSEDQAKQFKSLALLYRRKLQIGGGNNE